MEGRPSSQARDLFAGNAENDHHCRTALTNIPVELDPRNFSPRETLPLPKLSPPLPHEAPNMARPNHMPSNPTMGYGYPPVYYDESMRHRPSPYPVYSHPPLNRSFSHGGNYWTPPRFPHSPPPAFSNYEAPSSQIPHYYGPEPHRFHPNGPFPSNIREPAVRHPYDHVYGGAYAGYPPSYPMRKIPFADAPAPLANGIDTIPRRLDFPHGIGPSEFDLQQRKPKRRKDPSAPKNPLSAYLFFITEQRSLLAGKGDGSSFSQVAKDLGSRWKSMTTEEKAPYVEMARKDKERYMNEKKAFDKKKILLMSYDTGDS